MGGAIKAGNGALVSLTGSIFENNVANNAGVIYLENFSKLVTSNVTFSKNKAFSQSGVIEVVTRSYFTIVDTVF